MINLIQPLPIYDRVNEQARFKENCTGMYDLICTAERLIPFQIRIPYDTAVVTSLKIRSITSLDVITVDMSINSSRAKIVEEDGKKWFLFFGDGLVYTFDQIPLPIPCGYWYFEVKLDGDSTWFSEVFKVVNGQLFAQDPNMFIEAWHSSSMNGYHFENNFKFRFFFHSFITNTVPETIDEFLKDGYERNILQRRVIQFPKNIELDPLPNPVVVGLIAMTAMRNFVVTEIDGDEYVTKNVTADQETMDGGFLDSLKLTFTIADQDIVATNC